MSMSSSAATANWPQAAREEDLAERMQHTLEEG